jgi:hypothetical protein
MGNCLEKISVFLEKIRNLLYSFNNYSDFNIQSLFYLINLRLVVGI